MVLSWHATSRERPNFELRTTSTFSSQSTSSRSSRIASPMRSPVTASSPSSVSNVAACNGGVSRRAAASRTATSASEYR